MTEFKVSLINFSALKQGMIIETNFGEFITYTGGLF
jgi:hypothetical protein